MPLVKEGLIWLVPFAAHSSSKYAELADLPQSAVLVIIAAALITIERYEIEIWTRIFG